MAELSTSIIGKNMRKIRESLGLSQKDFSILVNLSRASIIKIEAGSTSYRLNLLDGVIAFTRFSLSELGKSKFQIPDNFRDRLIGQYKNNIAIEVILNQQPQLVYCIKYYLLKSNFLDAPKEIHEIVKYFTAKYGWIFSGNTVQVSLKRMPDLIKIEPHPSKKGTNVYLKK
jgi:transcriptional regulator with XRE-family HTH domain